MARKLRLVITVLVSVAASACGGKNAARLDDGGTGTAVEGAMSGTLYEPGRRFAQTYCSPCHGEAGENPKRPVAHLAFQVDTYEEWAASRTILLAVLDKWMPDGVVMPPSYAPAEPPDDERRAILDWVQRGSPNTPDGR